MIEKIEACETDFFSIIERDGEKFFVYTGFFYCLDDFYDCKDPWRYIKVNKGFGYELRIPDQLGRIDELFDDIAACRQSIVDLTEDEAAYEIAHYYDDCTAWVSLPDYLETNCGRGSLMDMKSVTEDTPCGSYYC